jgi:hypothetical protein
MTEQPAVNVSCCVSSERMALLKEMAEALGPFAQMQGGQVGEPDNVTVVHPDHFVVWMSESGDQLVRMCDVRAARSVLARYKGETE